MAANFQRSSNKRSYGARSGPSLSEPVKIGRGGGYKPAAGVVNLREAAILSGYQVPSMARIGGYSFKSTGGSELNFVDTNIGGTDSTTARIVLLNGMAQGTTASTRIGRRVNLKSFELKFTVSGGTATTFSTCRYAVVLDRQANAAAPNFTDIYDSAHPTALRNISNKARFQVLWDSDMLAICGNNTTFTDASRRNVTHYLKINVPTQYNAGTAGTVGDIQTGALYFVAIGDVVSGTTAPVCVGNLRLRYSD